MRTMTSRNTPTRSAADGTPTCARRPWRVCAKSIPDCVFVRTRRGSRRSAFSARFALIAGSALGKAVAAVALCLAASATSAAAEPTVRLELDSFDAYVNETVLAQIVVEDFSRVQPPEFPDLRNCSVQYVGPSSSMQIVNGVMSRSQTYTFQLRPREPGVLKIPAIDIIVDGKLMRTEPASLRVVDSSERPSIATNADGVPVLLAEASCRETRLYVGQRAVFQLDIFIKPATVNGQFLSPEAMWGLVEGANSGIGPFAGRPSSKRRQLTLDDGATANFYEYTLHGAVDLNNPGTVDFDGLTIAIQYPIRFARDFFGDLRVDRARLERIRPEITAPDVLPLPDEGRPADFSGAVGRYEIQVATDNDEVRVGDPIQLTVALTGEGAVEVAPPPHLAAQPDLVADFRVADESLAGRYVGDRKFYTPVIRAKRVTVTEIPPITYSYFNPETERYETARSRPIPIKVRAGDTLAADDVLEFGAPAGDDAEARPLDGLRGNKTSEVALLQRARPVTMTQLGLVTLAPAALFLIAWCGSLFAAGHNRESARRRAQTAARRAEKRIAAAGALSSGARTREIEAALAGYLADRLNQPPARFTGRAAIDFLQQQSIDADTLTTCSHLIQRCESSAYGGAADGDVALIDQARACITRLEREKL